MPMKRQRTPRSPDHHRRHIITGRTSCDAMLPLLRRFFAWVRLNRNMELSGGLNHAFDRKRLRIPGAAAGVYDVIGQTFFVGLCFTL